MPRKTFKKVIVAPEKLEKVNPKNKRLMEMFLNSLKKNHSSGTIKTYRSNLNIFFVWNLDYNDNKFFIDVKKIEMNEFFDFCVSELCWSPARYGTEHSSLSSLSNFIENMLDDDYPEFRNIVKKIDKLPNEKVRKKTIISEKEINDYLKQLVKEERLQEACYIALAISCGARFSELLRFTTDIIDEKRTVIDDIFLETVEEIQTKGRGQRGKMLKKYIIKDLFLPYYKLWLPEREKIMKEKDQHHNAIFLKRTGEPATPAVVRNWVAKWEEELGRDVYVHAFRHYTCTYLCNLVDEALVVDLFGWDSSEMVRIYNDTQFKDRKWDTSKLKKQIKK